MIDTIKRKILSITVSGGIEYVLAGNGECSIYSSTVELLRGEIKIKDESTGLTSVQELAAKFDKSIPLILVFNGVGILTKTIPDVTERSNLLSRLIPNLNPDDFYYSVTNIPEKLVISFARKVLIDEVINEFIKYDFKILEVKMGINGLDNFCRFLPNDSVLLSTNCFNLALNEKHEILTVEENKTNSIVFSNEYLINNIYVKNTHVIAFNAALNLLITGGFTDNNIATELLTQITSEFKDFKYYKVASMLLLATSFFMLLTSFISYNYYFTKNQEHQFATNFAKEKTNQYRDKERRVLMMESFLQKTGWVSSTKTSYYADRIGLLTTDSVTLSTLAIFPASSSSNLEIAGYNFRKDTIEINGFCNNPFEADLFVENLKKIKEFEHVSIKNYKFQKITRKCAFALEITLQ